MTYDHDVFISYSRKDKSVVTRIEQQLAKYGIKAFVDNQMMGGEDWVNKLGAAVSHSKLLVCLWSENSDLSKWVLREVQLAISSNIPVVPFKIGTFKGSMGFNLSFASVNIIFSEAVSDESIAELCGNVARFLGKDVVTQKSSEPIDLHVVKDDVAKDRTYRLGKTAFREGKIANAFHDLYELAIEDYKDSRYMIGEMMSVRGSVMQVREEDCMKVKIIADQKKDSFAQYVVSAYYGRVLHDNATSLKYAQLSADQLDGHGFYELSTLYEFGWGVEKDIEQSEKILQRSMMMNCPQAFIRYIKFIYNGWINKPDYARAKLLIDDLLDNEWGELYELLGDAYWNGYGVEYDLEEARRCFRKAIEFGYIDSYNSLANTYSCDPHTFESLDNNSLKEAFRLLQEGSLKGSGYCIKTLALNYYYGLSGIKSNNTNAYRWALKGAEINQSDCLALLGRMHYYGEGVDEDNEKAWQYLMRARKEISSQATYLLGMMCLEGYAPEGMTQKDSIPFFEESVYLRGFDAVSAALKLYEIYSDPKIEEGNPGMRLYDRKEYDFVPHDNQKAINYLVMMAEANNTTLDLAYVTGCMLCDQTKSWCNEVLGLEMLEYSLQLSDYRAALMLSYIYHEGDLVIEDKDKAEEYYDLAKEHLEEEQIKRFFGEDENDNEDKDEDEDQLITEARNSKFFNKPDTEKYRNEVVETKAIWEEIADELKNLIEEAYLFKTEKYSNGDVYYGEFKDGKRHGYGKYTWANGGYYEGEWQENERTGVGHQVWTDGTEYIGDYKINKWEGRGLRISSNGAIKSGIFHNDNFEGDGIAILGNKDMIVGDFVDGFACGECIYSWVDGEVYYGMMSNGNFEGYGCYHFKSGDKRYGMWKNDKKVGKHVYFYADGRTEIEEFDEE